MVSVYSVMFTLVLFSEFSTHSVCLAIPTAKLDDSWTYQENVMQGDGAMNEPALHTPVFRQSPILDNGIGDDEDNTPTVILLSDIGEKRHSRRGLNTGFGQALPLLTHRSADHTPAVHSLKIERREADLDMLRCMIGRVYRPCWKS